MWSDWASAFELFPSSLRKCDIGKAGKNYCHHHIESPHSPRETRTPRFPTTHSLFHPRQLDFCHLLGLGLFEKSLVDHEFVHFLPRFQLVELDFFHHLSAFVENGHDGLFATFPLDFNARVFVNLSPGISGLFALEEEAQFLVLVEGSRGAADDLGRNGLGQWQSH